MPALSSLLQPSVVNARISRLLVVNDTLQRAFGMQTGGSNEMVSIYGRRGSYDVFNDTRQVPSARTPGAAAASIPRQSVGNVPFVIPRSAEKMPMTLEDLHNLRRIGGPVGEIDALGESYIAAQEAIVKQRSVNLREFQIAAMLRGSYTYTQSGDDLTHDFSGGGITVNYQIPAGNKSQLNMTGGGDLIGTTWANAAAPICTDLFEINAAFIQLTGRGLKHVWCNSALWKYVLANTQVQAQAGSVNQVFDYITRDEQYQDFTARLKAIPWVQWHINDNGLDIGTTFTKLFADTQATFTPDITSDIANYWICSEPVIEGDGQREVARFGDYYYYRRLPDPARIELHGLRNGLPVLLIPKAIACATVVF